MMRRQSRDNLSARSCPPGRARDGPTPSKPGGDAEDLRARIMAQAPGRERDRGQVRLQVARRHIDDHPADFAGAQLGEPGRDRLEMPVHREPGTRVELAKRAMRKAGEIRSQQCLVASATLNLSSTADQGAAVGFSAAIAALM